MDVESRETLRNEEDSHQLERIYYKTQFNKPQCPSKFKWIQVKLPECRNEREQNWSSKETTVRLGLDYLLQTIGHTGTDQKKTG